MHKYNIEILGSGAFNNSDMLRAHNILLTNLSFALVSRCAHKAVYSFDTAFLFMLEKESKFFLCFNHLLMVSVITKISVVYFNNPETQESCFEGLSSISKVVRIFGCHFHKQKI